VLLPLVGADKAGGDRYFPSFGEEVGLRKAARDHQIVRRGSPPVAQTFADTQFREEASEGMVLVVHVELAQAPKSSRFEVGILAQGSLVQSCLVGLLDTFGRKGGLGNPR